MPSLQSASRNQFAVLWPAIGTDNFSNPILGPAEEIRVRWETGERSTKEQTGTVDAVVYVGKVIAKGSVLWLGRLAQVPTPNVATEFGTVSLYSVISYNEVPAVKGPNKTQWIEAMRRSSQIPQP